MWLKQRGTGTNIPNARRQNQIGRPEKKKLVEETSSTPTLELIFIMNIVCVQLV